MKQYMSVQEYDRRAHEINELERMVAIQLQEISNMKNDLLKESCILHEPREPGFNEYYIPDPDFKGSGYFNTIRAALKHIEYMNRYHKEKITSAFKSTAGQT